MASFLSTSNIPLLCIPAYHFLTLFPHMYAVARSSKGDMKVHDNRNPKGSASLDRVKKGLTAQEIAAFERGESCHRNGLENMPLYVAAIFAGLLAEKTGLRGAGDIGTSTFAVGYLGLRVVYTWNYLVTETRGWSFLRSAAWGTSTIWAFVFIARAAAVIGR